MATNRDLLKEAIADAKAVKEMAIANAKAALEEAFTPQLQSMLSAKLQEMETDPDEYEDEYVTDRTEEDDKPFSKEKAAKITDYELNEDGFGEFSDKNQDGFSSMSKKALDEEEDEEMDLDELLNELNEDMEDVEGYEDEDADGIPDENDEDSGEPLDLEDMTDEDLKKMIEDVIADMMESGELEAEHEASESEEEEKAEHAKGGSEEGEEEEEGEINLDELLAEIEKMEDESMMYEEDLDEGKKELAFVIPTPDAYDIDEEAEYFQRLLDKAGVKAKAKANMVGEEVEIYTKDKNKARKVIEKNGYQVGWNDNMNESSISELEAELSEAYSTIKSLRGDLNEVNLLNAKLLYSNKIFKSKNLTESQKVTVLSSFDKANSVGEVKLVFETLSEGLKTKTNTIKDNLGSASKMTSIPKTKQPIVESNDMVARFQKLAGII